MSLSAVIALAAALSIVSLVLMVVAIWLAARVWQVPEVSWRRAALATLWLTLGNWILAAAVLLMVPKLDVSHDNGLALLVCAVALAFELVLLVVGVGRPLRVGAGKAICVALTAYAAQSVVSLVLALACRERLLEAFVLPTGSMAPAVYGVHFNLICPNCGHEFATSASQRVDQLHPSEIEDATCLNCQTTFPISRTEEVANGDRILVDKRAKPRRWDCVTFREPSEARLIYLKCAVGLPGESLKLADGDLFIDGRRISKHPRRQTDLWLPCHDTSSMPRKHDDDTPCWRPAADGSHWSLLEGGGWAYREPAGEAESLNFRGEITDACQYNQYNIQSNGGGPRSVPLGDVRVTCTVAAFSGSGSLQLVWQFNGRELRFSADNSGGEIATADESLATSQAGPFIRPGEVLEFAVRDGVAYLLCGEAEISAPFLPKGFGTVSGGSPHPSEPCKLQLLARGCNIEISRLRIDCDIYFVTREEMSQRMGGYFLDGPAIPDVLGADQYFMLGDNVMASKDSRFIGPIPERDLIGVARWRYWPKARWHELD